MITKLLGKAIPMVLLTMVMHPVHETICEVQWNAEERCVEVAMRLNNLDEQWIQRTFQSRLSAKHTATKPTAAKQTAAKQTNDQWRERYLASHLAFHPAEFDQHSKPSNNAWLKAGIPIKWVGREEEGAHVWWYFEAIPSNGKPPRSIQTRMLFGREPDFQHRVTLMQPPQQSNLDAKAKTMILTREQPSAKLNF